MSISNDKKATILARLIEAGKKCRERFAQTAEELADYDANDAQGSIEWPAELSFYAKTNKTQQFKREIGARLLNTYPTYRAAPKRWAGQQSQMLAAMTEELLNISASETDEYYELQRMKEDALGPGRGVLWIGFDSKKRLPVVSCDTWDNLLTDPDARTWRECHWVARRRFLPRGTIRADYKVPKDVVDDLPVMAPPSGDDEWHQTVQGVDLVECWQVWMDWGIDNYTDDTDAEGLRNAKEPKVYLVQTDNSVLLDESEWPFPLHLESGRGKWPMECLDLYPVPWGMWPISPLAPGLGWLKAINYTATLLVDRYRRASRDLVAILKVNGISLDEESSELVLNGSRVFDQLVLTGNVDAFNGAPPNIKNYVQQLRLDYNFPESLELLRHFERMFEQETGLYEFLYVGNTDTQDRSAQATKARQQNSLSRVQEYQSHLDECLSRVARKKAIVARTFMNQEDVSRYLGPEAGQAWGVLNTTPVDQIAAKLVEQDGVDPETAMQVAQQIAGQSVDLQRILDETEFTVEVGSTRRRSPEDAAQAASEAGNQLLPTLLQIGALQSAGLIIEDIGRYNLNWDEAKVQTVRNEMMMRYQMMMQPQPQPQGQPTQGDPNAVV